MMGLELETGMQAFSSWLLSLLRTREVKMEPEDALPLLVNALKSSRPERLFESLLTVLESVGFQDANLRETVAEDIMATWLISSNMVMDESVSSLGQAVMPFSNLYIGSIDAAFNSRWLRGRVSHVLTVASRSYMAQNYFSDITYAAIEINDSPMENIYKHFAQCINFINEGRKKKGVLVHCIAGVSRSATIVAAYLIHELGITAIRAIQIVQRARSIVEPNDGFRKQLMDYERELKKNSMEESG